MSIQDFMLEDFFKLAGLPKKGGWFNSRKHGKFIKGYNFSLTLSSKDLKHYGIPELLDGQKAILFLGENVFSHGNRGTVPYQKVFIIDQYGVVKSYHVGGNGHGDQWYMNPEKVKLSFERNEKDAPLWVASYTADEQAEEKILNALPELQEVRQIVEGTVLSIKEVFSEWGSAFKMTLLLVDGNKVYSTIPKNIIEYVEVDTHLSMNVTVKHSSIGFYFGSRPAKGIIL